MQIIKLIFIFSGAKIYMDWFLITNPVSKNPLIKFLYGRMKKYYTGINYKERLNMALMAGIAHAVMAIPVLIIDPKSLINLAANIYPAIIQMYIGYRCHLIIKHKDLIKKNHLLIA